MENKKVALILNQIADLLEMDGIDFRTKAYRNAAHTVESLSVDIGKLKDEGRLLELPGIGKNLAKKIEEIIDTGSLKYYDKLKKETPVDFESLSKVEGLGPKTIKLLYHELGVQNLDDLEREAKRGHIHRLKGMGVKTERKILENLEFARKYSGRKLLGHILPLSREIKKEIAKIKGVERVEIAGSIRRRKETVGDIDILVITENTSDVMDFFTRMELIDEVMVQGLLKTSVRLKNGMDADLRVFHKKEFGSAYVYFTGSKEMNIQLRKRAIKRGLKLNEYGVFQGEEQIAGETEEDTFQALGLSYIDPELRENQGEIEAAKSGQLPDLVGYTELKGDLQMHTNWSDGASTLQEMAQAGKMMGHEYLAITDHTGGLRIVGGLNEDRIIKQIKKIDGLNEQIEGITLLKGVEVNIDSGGQLDVSDQVLGDLDVVVAAIHSGFRQDKEKMTERLVLAMENENVNIIAHPTGRKIQERRAYELDLNRIFQVARETGTLMEVNCQPNRLDLKDVYIRSALEAGCKVVISTDAHNKEQLSYAELGLATARRGWACKKDIINTLPLKKVLKYFN